MTILDCISIIKQYGYFVDSIRIESFDDVKFISILEINGKTIWLTESVFEIKIDVSLNNNYGDNNICVLSKIDFEVKSVALINNDYRIYKAISMEEFIESMDLSELDIRKTTLKKIFRSLFNSLNNLIPEQYVYGIYSIGNSYYFPKITDKERKLFEDQTIEYKKKKIEWDITRLKYCLKDRKEYLRFIPTSIELNKLGFESLDEIINEIENLVEFKRYIKQLEINMKIGINLNIENDFITFKFIEK